MPVLVCAILLAALAGCKSLIEINPDDWIPPVKPDVVDTNTPAPPPVPHTESERLFCRVTNVVVHWGSPKGLDLTQTQSWVSVEADFLSGGEGTYPRVISSKIAYNLDIHRRSKELFGLKIQNGKVKFTGEGKVKGGTPDIGSRLNCWTEEANGKGHMALFRIPGGVVGHRTIAIYVSRSGTTGQVVLLVDGVVRLDCPLMFSGASAIDFVYVGGSNPTNRYRSK